MGILTDDMKRIVREQRSGSDRRAGQRQDAFLLAEAVRWSRRMMPEELLRCQGIPFSPPIGWVIIIPVIHTFRNVRLMLRYSSMSISSGLPVIHPNPVATISGVPTSQPASVHFDRFAAARLPSRGRLPL